MAFRKIIESLPSFYLPLLPGVFQKEIPPEPFSDCLNCPMITKEGVEPGKDLNRPFSPYTKCCTFIPRLPNYMAGAILSDPDPQMNEGRKRLAAKIASGAGVYPNGVYPTPAWHRYYIENGPLEFGRNREMLCPYFTEGKYNCTIWKYRESICALWFCKHLAGIRGRKFWNAVIGYMKFMQDSLINVSAHLCGLQAIDPYNEGERPRYEEPVNSEEAVRRYADLWNDWKGREEQYYIRCFEIVSSLEEKYIKAIQDKGEPLAGEIGRLADDIIKVPELLKFNNVSPGDEDDSTYRIELENYIEILQKAIVWSFRMPRSIMDLFDGTRKTSDIVKEALKNQKIRIEPEILIALYSHGILTEEILDSGESLA